LGAVLRKGTCLGGEGVIVSDDLAAPESIKKVISFLGGRPTFKFIKDSLHNPST
jgi:hypothetical protein